MNPLDDYFQEQSTLLEQIPVAELDTILQILERARLEHKHIFVFGNGGSASTASHFAADLAKNTVRAHLPRFHATCLNDNMSILSAYANDVGYDSVFAEPLLSHCKPGDVAIGISVSGNSPNVVRAIQAANECGLTTIGFTGMNGGKLKELAQHSMNVPSQAYEHVEDIHLAFCHALVLSIKLRNP